MAVKIRLARHGSKGNPFYRIVVADSRSPRDGRFIDRIGTYDPQKEPSDIKVDEEKAREWLGKGAQPTDQVKNRLKISEVLYAAVAQLENLLLVLARALVDEPERVEVSSIESDARVDLELRVAPDDMGRVIGRQGRTIRAIRSVVKAASVKLGKRVNVEVLD